MPLSTGHFFSLKVLSVPRVALVLFLALMLIQPIAYAADGCSVWNEMEFSDGEKGCLTDYEFFNAPILNSQAESAVENVRGSGKFLLALINDLKNCPILSGINSIRGKGSFNGLGLGGTNSQLLLANCDKRAIEGALIKGFNPTQCDCGIIYRNDDGRGKILLTKQEFEKKSADYLALLPQKDRLTAFAGKPGSVPMLGGSEAIKPQIASSPVPIKVDASKLLQAELEKKQQLDKEQKLLAEKLRVEQEKKIVEEVEKFYE